jgi:uracil-DNA glycosylase
MEGFFTKKEVQSISAPDGKIRTCNACGLYGCVKTPKMQPYGNFRKGIMNIGEAPGETEDRLGKPWQGKAGQLLQKTYHKLGIDLFEDCINLNSVNCRPTTATGSNRTPTGNEIACCRTSILRYIDEYKPRVIVLLGATAIQSVIAHRWKKDFGTLNKWRGWTIPDQDFQSWLCPVFHPSYVMRYDTPEMYKIWEDDLVQAIEINATPLPVYPEPKIHYVDDLSVLETIKSGTIAIDYETTGLKPYQLNKDHKIISASIAVDDSTAYVFLLPEKRKDWRPLKRLLMNERVRKIAQNMKFEDVWSRVYLDTPVRNWYWDSMLASHVLDNRKGVTSLKFQTYVQFGVIDYSSEISPYLMAVDGKNGNSVNRVEELLQSKQSTRQLLKYNALDTIYLYRLAIMQMKQFEQYGKSNI